jgi:ribosomal protein L31E
MYIDYGLCISLSEEVYKRSIRLIPTFMRAHAVPKDNNGREHEFVE